MTNEELAAAVQAGEADVLELWAQVRRFALRRAHRWARAVGEPAGLNCEDLQQVAFLDLLDALERWEPGGYAFLTIYGNTLRSAFSAACGVQTEQARRDPLRCSPMSLDAPADPGDEDSSTLAELIADPAAAAALEDVTEMDRRERLHNALETALQQLSEAQRSAVMSKYYKGQQVDHAALSAALRALRHPRVSRPLLELWRG